MRYTVVNSRSKGKVIMAEDKPGFERGTITVQGAVTPAVRFPSGIVHSVKTRRGLRVSRAIAKTFKPVKEGS